MLNIDLFKLNNFNLLEIDQSCEIPKSYYENSEIRGVNDVFLTGEVRINSLDEVCLSLKVKGQFVLPCAISLEDVFYDFETIIDETIGNFNNFYNNKQNTLDILPIIWENIVSEVPIRVVKEGVQVENTSGNGWELVSED